MQLFFSVQGPPSKSPHAVPFAIEPQHLPELWMGVSQVVIPLWPESGLIPSNRPLLLRMTPSQLRRQPRSVSRCDTHSHGQSPHHSIVSAPVHHSPDESSRRSLVPAHQARTAGDEELPSTADARRRSARTVQLWRSRHFQLAPSRRSLAFAVHTAIGLTTIALACTHTSGLDFTHEAQALQARCTMAPILSIAI